MGYDMSYPTHATCRQTAGRALSTGLRAMSTPSSEAYYRIYYTYIHAV